jgi:CHAT domain-containing protein
VENEAATVVVVVRDNMRIHNSIHLACHGIQDTSQPLRSGFAMRDGRLELSDIIKIQNMNADLAFLSACQTSTGDERLPEEAVHLAGGMLAAGYQGVVATMWTINDERAVEIAKDFYNNLLSYGPESGKLEGLMSARAAYVLRYASERMRERLGDSEVALHAWVPYVHFGI